MTFGRAISGVCLTIILAFAASAQTTFYPTDFQIWNDTQITVPLTKKRDWNIGLWLYGRLGNTGKTPTDLRVGGLLTKKINNNLTVGGGYLYRYSNPSFVRRRYESRYIGIATVTVPLDKEKKKWTLVNRNFLQYEDRYSRANALVLRNRARINRKITINEKQFEPFVSFETFYDFSLKKLYRYRTQVGISRRLNKNLLTDVFYVRQDETFNKTRPGTLNGIGTSLRVNF